MQKTRVLTIRYDNKLSQKEIPLFRGAVIDTMDGTANILYHNHNGDALVYHYPLVQYKRINQCAAIVAIDAGADALGQFLSSGVTHLHIGEREDEFKVADIKASNCLVQVWDGEFEYHLRKWLPFNSENYLEYKSIEELSSKVQFMEKILVGNILSFAKGVGVSLESNVTCKIKSMDNPRLVIYKGVKMMSFDIVFKTNVTIPNFIGIGKGVSLGFGMVTKINNENSE
jgi:hypothetical protein